jgi:hypothetical protein
MSEEVERFFGGIPDNGQLTKSDTVDWFVYFLTEVDGRPSASATEINHCFDACNLPRLGRIAAYLREGTRGNSATFIKTGEGYKLTRSRREEIASALGKPAKRVQAAIELRKLLGRMVSGPKKEFMKELVDCYEAGANRATIVMCWILAVDTLFDHIIGKRLSDFNTALAANTDKRVKVTAVKSKDDFGDIPEKNFIDLCRVAKIINNDLRKILEEKLGTRNSAAHPSTVIIAPSKAVEFVEDMIENVVLKFT